MRRWAVSEIAAGADGADSLKEFQTYMDQRSQRPAPVPDLIAHILKRPTNGRRSNMASDNELMQALLDRVVDRAIEPAYLTHQHSEVVWGLEVALDPDENTFYRLANQADDREDDGGDERSN